MQLFLGLALACFVVIVTLKYANPVAREEVAETLSGAHPGAYDGQGEFRRKHATRDGDVGVDGEGVTIKQEEIPAR